MERPRAADDFDMIRGRLEELRREREEIASNNTADKNSGDTDPDADAEQRRKEQCEVAPPSWVPTIFLPQPTD
jgi:hypothetical protein